MKKNLFALTLFTSMLSFAEAQLQKNLDQAVEDYSINDDIEVILFKPPWSCGPCSLFESLVVSSSQDDIFNATSWLGRVFNDEINFKTAKITDARARELKLIGYPTTVIYKNGKYLGHSTGAMTTPKLGKMLDKATNRNKYEKKGSRYMRIIHNETLQVRMQNS
jgi:hypothetical protein